ncbi:CB1 cannabinoid receptor-interacting protein 1 [Dermatophagoides pteronyssinus]|uniref:CB1 cannabinoid receptor-interacting protein 1 n=1 Tax=Dermatophagoides pteronyssinus TaxID=6956 RepID=A0ABQ8JL55_DERPT|nr:CB1 cannabinoid receptor-interacting protein 1 [Dermatophagoides pteronyssinus]
MNNKNSIGCIIRIYNEYSKQQHVDGGNHETMIPLYFKEDGQRFRMQQTLKMLINSAYNFEIQFKGIHSNLKIQLVKIDLGIADQHDIYSSTFVDFNLHNRNHRSMNNNNSRQISFIWDSNGKIPMEKIRKKRRDFLTITIILSNMTTIEIRFQIRFYMKPDKHFSWGEELDHCKGEILINNCNGNRTSNPLMIINPTLIAKPKYFRLLEQQQQKQQSMLASN